MRNITIRKIANICFKAAAAAAIMLAVVMFSGIVPVRAGEIFTRDSTKLSYPSTRSIALKTEMIGKELRFFTSDHSVATVDKDGMIMTVGVGECKIFVRSAEGIWDVCHVTVEEPDAPHKQIALTFDDGPGYYGEELMDYLAEKGVHVTFFYIGNQISKYSGNVYRAYNEGHEIGNHSWSHPVMSTETVEQITDQLSKTNEAIKEACGAYPTIYRPPYGSKSDRLLENCNFPVILWSVDTLDWQYKDVDWVSQQVYEGASDGAVILVHEIHKTTIGGIKIAVDKLLEEGWEFVTITELMERDGSKMYNGGVYSRKKN